MQSTAGMISKMTGFLDAFEHVRTTESTNADVLAGFGHEVDPRPLLADYQTAGRGRLGRVWHSDQSRTDDPAASENSAAATQSMLGSIPQRWRTGELGMGLVPFAAGLATVDVVQELVPDPERGLESEVRLGWPNDVIVHRDGRWRKLAGILVESVPLNDGSLGVVVGVGLNLSPVRQTSDRAIVTRAISLGELGGEDISNAEVFSVLIRCLAKRTAALRSDRARFMDDYRLQCATIGEPVEVQLGIGPLVGMAASVADSGELVVVDLDGRTHRVSVGDVVIRPGAGNG